MNIILSHKLIQPLINIIGSYNVNFKNIFIFSELKSKIFYIKQHLSIDRCFDNKLNVYHHISLNNIKTKIGRKNIPRYSGQFRWFVMKN